MSASTWTIQRSGALIASKDSAIVLGRTDVGRLFALSIKKPRYAKPATSSSGISLLRALTSWNQRLRRR